jgi:hypothetical protein
MTHVEKMLTRLRKHELYVSPETCAFMSTEIEFLGFIAQKYDM